MAYDQDLSKFKPGEVDNISIGQNGFLIESGTTALTSLKVFCIEFIEAGAFSAFTASPTPTGDAVTGITFPAGFKVFGRISAFTLSAGKVIAYKYAE